jgi:hypothetical protein
MRGDCARSLCSLLRRLAGLQYDFNCRIAVMRNDENRNFQNESLSLDPRGAHPSSVWSCHWSVPIGGAADGLHLELSGLARSEYVSPSNHKTSNSSVYRSIQPQHRHADTPFAFPCEDDSSTESTVLLVTVFPRDCWQGIRLWLKVLSGHMLRPYELAF